MRYKRVLLKLSGEALGEDNFAGAKRAEIIEPVFTVLKAWEIARENSVKITFGGFEDG